jgi:hypothetical protein
MDVEEDEPSAVGNGTTVDAANGAAHFVGDTDRDMARDNRIRHAREAAVPKMDVGPADLRKQRLQQDRPGLERRLGKLTQLHGDSGGGHHRGLVGGHGCRIARCLCTNTNAAAAATISST